MPGAPVVTEQVAMAMPPFGRAVELLCNATAGTQWYARKLDKALGVRVPLEDQPAIVTDPSPLQTLDGYKWSATEDGILYGNHFALNGDLDWRTGRPAWVLPLPADQVWIATDPGRPAWYEWVIGGETFDVDEIFHVGFGARSGEILGRGVLTQYAEWLSGVEAAEEYSRDVFAAGALPPAVITTNQGATQVQLDELKLKWRNIVAAREPVILPTGTVVTPVVGNSEQAQLVQARTWNAQQVANAVGVPGWKLGLDGPSMTYQNIEDGDIDFVRDSVDRYGRPLTSHISKWLLPAGTELVWDYDSRMRADQKTTADVLTQYVSSKILTVDEARAKLNKPPLAVEPAPTTPPTDPAAPTDPPAPAVPSNDNPSTQAVDDALAAAATISGGVFS
jgi:HK97 family phage portal protein